MIKFLTVIPATAGIQKVPVGAWIPGLRSAAPGITVIAKYCLKKNLIIECQDMENTNCGYLTPETKFNGT